MKEDCYSRQRALKEIGEEGQKRISSSRVLIVGVGGLGCPASLYLALAGVGTIGLVDHDVVSESNLARQILFRQKDVGLYKASIACHRLKRKAPNTKLRCYKIRIEDKKKLVKRYDVVLDCTDNIQTRRELSDACRKYSVPLVSASALKWEGQLCVYSKDDACQRCVHSEPNDSCGCDEAGILGGVTGALGAMQAVEAIKRIVGIKTNPRMLVYDGLGTRTTTFNLSQCAEHTDVKGPKRLRWRKVLDDPEKYVVLDVRPKVEFELEKVETRRLEELNEETINALKRQIAPRELVVSCNKGIKSLKVGTEYGLRDILGGAEEYKRVTKDNDNEKEKEKEKKPNKKNNEKK